MPFRSGNPEHGREGEPQRESHLGRLAGKLITSVDPTVDGFVTPSILSTYSGFTDTPEGHSARTWTQTRIEEIRQRYAEPE